MFNKILVGMKKIYYTYKQAMGAAKGFAAENGGEIGDFITIDKMAARGFEEDEHFSEYLPYDWTRERDELEAREVIRDNEEIGVFAWWQDEDEIELPFTFRDLYRGCATFNSDAFAVDEPEQAAGVWEAFQRSGGVIELIPEDGEGYEDYARQLDFEPGDVDKIYVSYDGCVAWAKI